MVSHPGYSSHLCFDPDVCIVHLANSNELGWTKGDSHTASVRSIQLYALDDLRAVQEAREGLADHLGQYPRYHLGDNHFYHQLLKPDK